jgi:decaprenyl-phosphate phosphoribosyltransferase
VTSHETNLLETALVVVLCYLLLQLAYVFELKQRPILDVMCIALGFVLRAIAGVFALRVEITSWLVVCVFTLCLFMGFCKRWNEISVLGSDPRTMICRKTLSRYSPEILTHLVTLSATIAIISYLLYVLSPTTVERFGTNALVCTLPLVMYGVCRFAMVSMEGRYADPIALFLHDEPMIGTTALWLLCVTLIISMGGRLNLGIHMPP